MRKTALSQDGNSKADSKPASQPRKSPINDQFSGTMSSTKKSPEAPGARRGFASRKSRHLFDLQRCSRVRTEVVTNNDDGEDSVSWALQS